MSLTKVNYIDNSTIITAQNLNDIQDNIIQNAELIKKAAPRNLLDNSDFTNPVNQRGQTSYNLTQGSYGIDRWMPLNVSAVMNTVELTDNGIIFGNKNNEIVYLTQRFEKGYLDRTKTYTFVSYFADGTISFGGYIDFGNAEIDIVNLTFPANTKIKQTALYEGKYTAETLPEYQPKGYSAELLECQRYANVIEASQYSRIGLCDVTEGTSDGLLMVNTTQMRQGVVPSVSLISGNWTDLKLRNSAISVTGMTGFGYQAGTTHPFFVSLDGVNPSTRIEPILNTSANVVKILISLDL